MRILKELTNKLGWELVTGLKLGFGLTWVAPTTARKLQDILTEPPENIERKFQVLRDAQSEIAPPEKGGIITIYDNSLDNAMFEIGLVLGGATGGSVALASMLGGIPPIQILTQAASGVYETARYLRNRYFASNGATV